MSFKTRMASLASYEKGTIEFNDDLRHYAFSNIFEVCNNSKPYERVMVVSNLEYAAEAVRAEGTSPWYTAPHDEFAIVLAHEADIRLGANTLAQRLMEAICAPYEIDGLPLRVYLSVGVGIAPLDGEDADALMQNADLALYQAKAAGRRTVRF